MAAISIAMNGRVLLFCKKAILTDCSEYINISASSSTGVDMNKPEGTYIARYIMGATKFFPPTNYNSRDCDPGEPGGCMTYYNDNPSETLPGYTVCRGFETELEVLEYYNKHTCTFEHHGGDINFRFYDQYYSDNLGEMEYLIARIVKRNEG